MSANAPEPKPGDLVDALGPWVLEQHLSPRDFTRHYEGYMSVDEICRFDNDLSWLVVSCPADLNTFRNGDFADASGDMSPIIVVTAPGDGRCHTQVGDGRGRVNYARAYGMRLHVWHLVHKACV